MKKVAILSLDPRNGGGILHSLQQLYVFCEQEDFAPTVFFVNFDPAVSAGVKNFTLKSKIVELELFGMRCVGIGSRWAFWEPGHYQFTLTDWAKALEGFDYFWVSSGTAIAGHPLVLLGKKFVAWLATPLLGDREGKRAGSPVRALAWLFARPKMLSIEAEVLARANYLLPMSMYAKIAFEKLARHKIAKVQICGYPMPNLLSVAVTPAKTSLDCISIGRFTDPRKDVATLLSAWQIVATQKPEAVLHLVGETPAAVILKKFANLFALGSVVVHEKVSQAEKYALLNQSDVAIISSLQEGLCIAGLEAASVGLPIVATDCGGPSDYVIESITGFVVAVGDVKTMAAKILKLLTNVTLRQKMGAQGKALVKHFFDAQRIFKIFRTAMQEVWPELAVKSKQL